MRVARDKKGEVCKQGKEGKREMVMETWGTGYWILDIE